MGKARASARARSDVFLPLFPPFTHFKPIPSRRPTVARDGGSGSNGGRSENNEAQGEPIFPRGAGSSLWRPPVFLSLPPPPLFPPLSLALSRAHALSLSRIHIHTPLEVSLPSASSTSFSNPPSGLKWSSEIRLGICTERALLQLVKP